MNKHVLTVEMSESGHKHFVENKNLGKIHSINVVRTSYDGDAGISTITVMSDELPQSAANQLAKELKECGI